MTELTAEVDDATLTALAVLGLRFLGQRVTTVDKVLGGYETVDGKSKRKNEWKRNSVEFTPELAATLASECFSKLEFPDSTDEAPHFLDVLCDITQYEGSTAEVKFAPEKRAVESYLTANDGKLKSGEPRTVATFCANRGIEEPTVEDYKEDTAFLTAVKAWLKSVAVQE